MKPRTSFQKQVVASNARLTAISPKAVSWAVKHLIEHPAFRTPSKTTVCGDCGHKFRYEGKALKIRCPKCGNMLKVKNTLRRKIDDSTYFATFDTIDGLQVERVFLLSVRYRKGEAVDINNTEICRLWLSPKGNIAVTSLARCLGCYMDTFNMYSGIELRTLHTVHWVISEAYIYPRYKLIPELKRNGMNIRYPDCHPLRLMKALLTDHRIETLIKTGNHKAVIHFLSNSSNLDLCWNSHKIAMRRGYEITDYGLWCDTIRLLAKCGRDIRSAKYICPSDLNVEHDRWLDKFTAMERKRIDEERIKRDREREADFIRNKSCFFGIVISDDDIEVSVLDSIEAYKAEGDAMHHCVYNCMYYSYEDSVILSAHDKDGNRIETVEFSLTENKVIQSRGICNQNTEHHDRIINLVNANAHRFIEARASA